MAGRQCIRLSSLLHPQHAAVLTAGKCRSTYRRPRDPPRALLCPSMWPETSIWRGARARNCSIARVMPAQGTWSSTVTIASQAQGLGPAALAVASEAQVHAAWEQAASGGRRDIYYSVGSAPDPTATYTPTPSPTATPTRTPTPLPYRLGSALSAQALGCRSRCTSKTEISAGLTPAMRDACPTVSGRCRSKRSLASLRKPITPR